MKRPISTSRELAFCPTLVGSCSSASCNLLFRKITECHTDAIVVLDTRGLIRYANPAASAMLGKSLGDLVGAPFGYPVRTDRPQELDIVTPSGATCCAEMRFSDIEFNGEPLVVACLRDITELVWLREELAELSLVDDLTGLYNRRGLRTLVDQQRRLAARRRERLVLLFVDVDGLKEINDLYGHASGDFVIQQTAEILRHVFRSSDIVARVGGDEFVVVALEANERSAARLESRLHETVDEWNRTSRHSFSLAISVGSVSFSPDDEWDLQELLAAADRGMYAAKRSKAGGSAVRSAA